MHVTMTEQQKSEIVWRGA